MPSPSSNVAALRQLLAERFPSAPRTSASVLATGLGAVDDVCGGLPRGALTEIVCAAPSCGGQLLLGQLLRSSREQRLRVALIDGNDEFDPQSWPAEYLAHVVWVRCKGADQALQVADVLARDANLGLVVLDLRHCAEKPLRRIPASAWYRLQRAAEQSDLALMVESPRSLVPSAQLRFSLDQPHTLAVFDVGRHELATQLDLQVQRQRMLAASG
jgi:hypothetical protein